MTAESYSRMAVLVDQHPLGKLRPGTVIRSPALAGDRCLIVQVSTRRSRHCQTGRRVV